MSEKSKQFQRSIARNIFYCTRAIVKHTPYPIYKVISGFFIFISINLMRKRSKIMAENLDLAYGDAMSAEEKLELTKKCNKNLARGMLDLIYFIDRPDEVRKCIQIEGMEHLEKALEGGKGVIFLSGHFGIFIGLYLRMALEDVGVNVIMRRVRDDVLEEYISDFRKANGINAIYNLPAMKCVTGCLKALRKNETLFILLDQHYGAEGNVTVDFFNRPAKTATGPVVFHNRTNAPVLPIFAIRGEGDHHHRIIIEPPVDIVQHDDPDEMTRINVQNMSDIIEDYVRKYPHEWSGWLHKRWK